MGAINLTTPERLADAVFDGTVTFVQRSLVPLNARLDKHSRAVSILQSRIGKLAGEVGPQGPKGDTGGMPRHEWDGPRLRFEQEPGVWGEFVDLEGPRGKPGAPAQSAGFRLGSVVDLTSTPSTTNGYWPAGW